MSEWISIKDKMPDKYERVLISEGKSIHIGVYDGDDNKFYKLPFYIEVNDIVTHWISLPELPK